MEFKKGDRKHFLDYEIVYCENDDGIVLLHHNPYEHLGNFSTLDAAQQSAVIHYMIARPQIFKQCIHNRIMHGPLQGTQYEWYKMKECLAKEGIEMPPELIKPIGFSSLIGYNEKPLTWQTL